MCKEIFESLCTDDAALEPLDMRWYLTAQVRHASAAILLPKSLSCKRPFLAVYKVVNYLSSPWSTASLLMFFVSAANDLMLEDDWG